jgi:hypothetical protein
MSFFPLGLVKNSRALQTESSFFNSQRSLQSGTFSITAERDDSEEESVKMFGFTSRQLLLDFSFF